MISTTAPEIIVTAIIMPMSIIRAMPIMIATAAAAASATRPAASITAQASTTMTATAVASAALQAAHQNIGTAAPAGASVAARHATSAW